MYVGAKLLKQLVAVAYPPDMHTFTKKIALCLGAIFLWYKLKTD